MADSVRRSSRRSKPSFTSNYSIGDIVEVTRNGVIAEGRLAYKLTTGTSPNPRWLVKFDKEPWKDEELYEHVFGKVLTKANSSIGKSKSNQNTSSHKQKSSTNNGRTNTSRGTSSAATTSSEAEDNNKKSVTISSTQQESPLLVAGSEGESQDGRSALALAREERSKRRQAKVQEDVGDGINNNKRTRPNNNNNKNSSSNKKTRRSNDDEVIKVPMLTGTLYLYRGLQRRAEFVRKI